MKLRILIAMVLALGAVPAAAQVNPGTQPLSGAKGGTNNGFMQFTGPAGSIKTYTLPNANSTLAAINQIQIWTGAQSFTDSDLVLLGSSSGSVTLHAPATGGVSATFFSGTDTVAGIAAVQTLTNKTFASSTDILGGVTMGLGSDAPGDIYYNLGGVLTRLPKGSNGQALELVSGLPAWATVTGTGTVSSAQVSPGGGITVTTTSGANPCTTTCNLTISQRAVTKQVFTAGASGTYTTPAGVQYIEITIIGGGGGGGGGNNGSGATNGNPSCWNTTGAACTTPVYQAGGGVQGVAQANPGTGPAGGTISGSGTCDWSVPGAAGGTGALSITSSFGVSGGKGGDSSLGGGGTGSYSTSTAGNGATNSGAGGGGGGTSASASVFSGTGGGAGATCHVVINSPAATYTYVAAATAAGASAGSNGGAGGAGAGGQIIVYEH